MPLEQDNSTITTNDENIDRVVASTENAVDPRPEAITPTPAEDVDLQAEMNAFDAKESEIPQVVSDLGMEAIKPESEPELQRRMDTFDATGVTAPDDIQTRALGMHSARGIISSKDLTKSQQISSISKDLNVPADIVSASLENMSEAEFRTRNKIPEISRRLPILAKWMARPDNYALAENTGDWTIALTKASQPLNTASDFTNMIKKTAYEYPKGAVYTMLLSGAVSKEKAQSLINAIEDEQNGIEISAEGQRQLQELSLASEANTPANTEFVKALGEAWRKANIKDKDKHEDIDFGGLYDKTAASLDGVLNFLETAYANPKGAKLMAAQLATSSGPATAIGVAGGLLRRPKTGAAIAAPITAMLSVGESMSEDLEEFRNPQTGKIDIVKAFSDPDRVSRYRKRSSAYAAAMGASEFLYSKYIGEGFTKVLKSGAKGGVKEGAKLVAKDAVVGGLEEGGSQLTASIARDAVVGEVTEESVGKALSQAQTEAVAGMFMGGSIGAVKASVSTGKQAFYKVKTELTKATRAAEDMVALHEAKVTAQQDEAYKTNKDQVSNLIKDVTQPPPLPDDVSIYDDVKEREDVGAQRLELEAVSGSVMISPSETKAFFENIGLNVNEVLQELPAEVYETYLQSVESDTSVNIEVGDWMLILEDHPEIDEIARINGNDYNAREASEIIEGVQAKPFTLFSEILPEDRDPNFDENDESELPPLPETPEEIAAEESIIGTPFETSETIRLADIKTKFRSEDDTKAFNIVRNRLVKGTKGAKKVSEEAAAGFAEIQYARLRNRAQILGRDTLELVKEQKIQGGRSNRVYGSYNHFFNKVFFGQAADAATIVHEFGHSWLHEMSDDYTFLSDTPRDKMTPAQLDYWYAMEKTAELSGLANIGMLNNMDRKEEVRIHESFAQTTEMYFVEGDFSNSTVKAAMESFRKYMTAIIEDIRRYLAAIRGKGFIPFEITPEVERLFEGIIGVDYQADEVLNPMFQAPMFDQDTLGDQFEGYNETRLDAATEAVGVFASRIMKSSYAERENLINSAINQAVTRAELEIDTTSEMQIGAQMKDQYDQYKEAKKEGKEVQDPRVSYSSFLELFDGDETAAAIARAEIPNFLVAPKKRGGMDASILMGVLDMTSGEELVNTFGVIGQREELIERRADEIIDEEYPILKDDQQIRDDAVESLGNQKMSKFLNMEMKILAEKYLPTLKNAAAFFIQSPEGLRTPKDSIKLPALKYDAQVMVTDSPVHRFSSRLFQIDFGKHTREAAKFFRQGDWAKAFDSKVRATRSYHAARVAQAAQKKIAQTKVIAKQFLKYTKNGDYKLRYNAELVLFGRDFINVVNTGEGDLPVLTLDMFPGYSGITTNVVEGINKHVQDFNERSMGAYGANMTVGSFIEFGAAIKFIKKQAIEVKKLEKGVNDIRLAEAEIETAITFSEAPGSPISYERTTAWNRYKIEATLANSIIRGLYPDDITYVKSALGTAAAELETGEATSAVAKQQDWNRLFSNFEKIAAVSPKGSNLTEIMGPLVSHAPFMGSVWNYDSNSKPIVSSELGMTFNNMSELITAELLMGSPSGAEKFLRGGTESHPAPIVENYINGEIDTTKWDAFRRRLISEGVLTKAHYDAMQDIWNMFDEKHQPLKEAFRKTDNYLIGRITGRKINTPWGTYNGAYMPVAQDRELVKAANFNELLDMTTQRISGMDMYPRQNTGMTNQRNSTFTNVSLDANRIMLYMAATNDIIHMREGLINYGKILGSPAVQQELKLKRPGAMENVIVPSFERVRNQRRRESSTSAINGLATKLRVNVNRSVYLGNYMTVLKQNFGLIPAMSVVDKKYITKASLEVAANPIEIVKEVEALSAVMRDRFRTGVQRHVITDYEDISKNFDWVAKLDKKIDIATFAGIQFMQNRVDVTIWLAAQQQGVDQGLTPAQAAQFADNSVKVTQSSSAISYVNNAQSQNAISQLIQGMATSYSFSMHNLVTVEVMRNPEKLASAKRLISAMLLIIILPSIMDAALETADKVVRGDEEDDEDNLEARLTNIASRAATGILDPILPVVGRQASTFIYRGGFSFIPLIDKAERELNTGIAGIKRNAQGINMTPREMQGLLRSFTIFTGVPTSLLAKDVFVEDIWLNGEDLDDRLKTRKRQVRRLNRGNR